MKRNFFSTWLLLAIVMLLVVGACAPQISPEAPASSSSSSYPSSSGSASVPTLNIYASGGVASLEPIISASGIPNKITYRGGAELVKEMENLDVENGPAIHAFIVDSRFWAQQSENFVDPVTITNSYSVSLVDPVLSAQMGWLMPQDLYAADIKEAFDREAVRLGATSSSTDETGLSFLSSYLTAIKANREPLTLDDLSDPAIMDVVAQYAAALNNTAGDIDLLLKEEIYFREFGGTQSNLIIAPENAAIAFNLALLEKGMAPMDIFYVADATSMQTYIYGCSRGLSDDLQAQCDALADVLTSDEAQAEMLAMGYRSTEMGMALKNADPAVFNPAWGIRADEEFVLATLPIKTVMYQIQFNWSKFYKPATATAFVDDFSGSMESCDDETGEIKQRCEDGDESRNFKLMRAMQLSLLGLDGYQLPIGEDDITIVLPFSGGVEAVYSVAGNNPEKLAELYTTLRDNHNPGGGTAIYNSLWEAIRQLEANVSATKFKLIILLTDGENTNGAEIDEFLRRYKEEGYTIPIYAISLGGADDTELQRLTDETNGDFCDGRGDLEQLNHCFLRFRSN